MVKRIDMKAAILGVCFDTQRRIENHTPDSVLKWMKMRLEHIEKERDRIERYARKEQIRSTKPKKYKVVKTNNAYNF